MKSIQGITTFVLDEAEELEDENTFNKINYSIRTTSAKNTVIIIMNPASEEHWVYKRWIKDTHRIEVIDGYPVPISTHPNVTHIHTSYLDNIENLSEDFIKEAKEMKAKDPEQYSHTFIGLWGTRKTGLEAYHGYKKGVHVGHYPFKKDLPVHLSNDQNVVPWIYSNLWQIDYVDEWIILHCFDEIALEPPRHQSREVCKEFKKRWRNKVEETYLYGDASGSKRDTRSLKTDYVIMAEELAGFLARDYNRVWSANPSIKKRIEFVNEILIHEEIKGQKVKIIIAPHCVKLQTDLAMIKTDANGAKLKEKTGSTV